MSQLAHGHLHAASAECCVTEMQKAKKQDPRSKGLRNILVPIDFSAASEKAFQHAMALAMQYRSHVTLLHVLTASESPNGTENAKSAKKNLSALCKEVDAGSKRCKSIVRTGVPFFEITQCAEENGADVIVVGRSSTGVGRFGDGHTADRVLRYAKCPVLIVTETGGDFVAMPDASSSI